jgi:hypothetical protein
LKTEIAPHKWAKVSPRKTGCQTVGAGVRHSFSFYVQWLFISKSSIFIFLLFKLETVFKWCHSLCLYLWAGILFIIARMFFHLVGWWLKAG